jgi:hypothetical protein
MRGVDPGDPFTLSRPFQAISETAKNIGALPVSSNQTLSSAVHFLTGNKDRDEVTLSDIGTLGLGAVSPSAFVFKRLMKTFSEPEMLKSSVGLLPPSGWYSDPYLANNIASQMNLMNIHQAQPGHKFLDRMTPEEFSQLFDQVYTMLINGEPVPEHLAWMQQLVEQSLAQQGLSIDALTGQLPTPEPRPEPLPPGVGWVIGRNPLRGLGGIYG